MLRIWFNRTYATTYHLVAMLRANPDGRELHVIGSHNDPDSPVLVACDEAHPEPETDESGYVEWALAFAREHRVEVLIPRVHMAALADARAQFAEVGTTLMCPDGDTVRLFADKPSGYRAAAELGLAVPPYAVVSDSAGLRAACQRLAGIADQLCVKPVAGVGGDGFRRLTTEPPRLADFAGQVRSQVRVEDVCAALDRDGPPERALLVAPFLDGIEISVDAVAAADGALCVAVGRQQDKRRRLIVDDPDARHIAETLIQAHRVGYLSNTQVRYWQGPADPALRPYLIELNTRAAGGLFQTRLAGVNLPWAAVRLALGETAGCAAPKFGAGYASLASAVELP